MAVSKKYLEYIKSYFMIFIELPEETYKVQTKIIVVDFTKGKEIFKKIDEEIKGLEIGILVNNVGKAYRKVQYFHRMLVIVNNFLMI